MVNQGRRTVLPLAFRVLRSGLGCPRRALRGPHRWQQPLPSRAVVPGHLPLKVPVRASRILSRVAFWTA